MRAFCKCSTPFETSGPVGRADTCVKCGRDLHACVQCQFHDRHAQNECREPDTEPVFDREHGNFCDHFRPFATAPAATTDPREAARKKLASLFKK